MKEKIIIVISLFVIIIAVFLTVSGIYNYLYLKSGYSYDYIEKYIEQSPELIFKKINFNKYFAFGKPEGVNSFFEKLYLYYVSGDAVFKIPLKNLSVDRKKTDLASKVVYLNVSEKDFIRIDVNIPVEGIKMAYEIKPKGITGDEAEKISSVVSPIGGVLGAWIGAKLGSSVGSVFGIPGKLIGGIGGGAAAGAGAYIATNNFVVNASTDFSFEGNKFGEQEELFSQIKNVVSLELMGEKEIISTDDWEEKIIDYYKKEAEKSLSEFFRLLGFDKTVITYRE